MGWRVHLRDAAEILKRFLEWALLGVVIGGIGGLLGAGFHYALHFVTHLRGANPWLIYLLPLGGVASVGLYALLKLSKNRGTNEIIDATLNGQPVKPQVAPGIFLATTITHLFGGSAGREGAALQLGGSLASFLAKAFKLPKNSRKLSVMTGMSAVFAGLFGTPLTATVFCMEFSSVGTLFSPALLPCFLSAFTASRVSALLGVHAETHILTTAFSLDPIAMGQYLLLAVLVSLLGVAMCSIFHKAEHWSAHLLQNLYVRILIGGSLLAVMTLLVGDQRFNGAGMELALQAVSGNAEWYSFLLKLLFTAVTLAAGFKGGEIVPTFCIGATFGCVIGGLLGMDPGFGAALGLVGLFCCSTNSVIASIFLSLEMFGGTNVHIFALVCVICFVLSGRSGLYASQILQFEKAARFGKSKNQ